jgi:hypothetical protein
MDRHDVLHLLGLRCVRDARTTAREASDERSRTLKRTDACGFPERTESRGVIEAARSGDSESDAAGVMVSLAAVSSHQLVLETEGAEPGSTNVDGSSQASSPTMVRDIIRTLLT